MSTAVATDRITEELDLLNEDPSAYADRLGLPVDASELIDPELLYEENSISIVLIVFIS